LVDVLKVLSDLDISKGRHSIVFSAKSGPYAGFFHYGGSKGYMPKNVPNIQRVINNDILKIVNIVFSGEQLPPCPPPLPRCVRPCAK
jgi:hypothetical protein